MKIHHSLKKFGQYVDDRLLRQVISPCGRLVLWNYTDHCTYEKAWDDVTLNARGTVYEIATGKVVARAFPKFFNFGELNDDKKADIINARYFESFEKMDGSLGIVYFYDGEWRVNTRGSFTSDQAIKGKEMLDSRYKTKNMNKENTYLVEIVYPENKIIVNYGQEEFLSLLGIYNNEYETDLNENIKIHSLKTNLIVTPATTFDSIVELQNHLETLDHTEEGYVVRLENGYRVKFKSAEYLRVARIVNHLTPLSLWKAMENGVVKVDYLEHLPEEFREEADALVDQIEASYGELDQALYYEYSCIGVELRLEDGPTPENLKKLGLYIKEGKSVHGSVHFNFLKKSGRIGLDKYIMKTIRPTGNQL